MRKRELPTAWRKMQGHFNAKKADFIMALKDRGTFIEHCKKRGFLYSISLTMHNVPMTVHVALKNGSIEVIDVIQSNQPKAV